MSILVIRHGLSEANDRNRVGGLAFDAEQASLMPDGLDKARQLQITLESSYGIDPSSVPAATSKLLRAHQTAQEAGFTTTNQYSQLDEVKHGMNLAELRTMLDYGQLPQIALQEAQATLEDRPNELVWFTHGLRIAGLCALLGVYQDERLIPRFCEIRELPIVVAA